MRKVLHIIIIFLFSLTINSCAKKDDTSTAATQDPPTNADPIYLTSISSSLTTNQYDTKFQDGINVGLSYFGSIKGVHVYIYDTNGLETIAKDLCTKKANYNSGNYDQCYSDETSTSTEYTLKSSVISANSSSSFTAALNGNTNGFYPIIYAISDTPNDNASYIAHIAIHEYAHVYQHHYNTAASALAYSTWIQEGYAQMIGQLLRSQNGYLTFDREMANSFYNFRAAGTDQSSLLSSHTYVAGSWAMAYLINKVNVANSCTSNCVVRLDAVKTSFQKADESGDATTSFESTFGFTLSSFENEVSAYFLAIDFTSSSTTAATTWATNFYNSIPSSL